VERAVEQGAGGRESPDGVREGVIKKRPAGLNIVKRLGRFYWCKDGSFGDGKDKNTTNAQLYAAHLLLLPERF
jgi:hypothetical protein